MLLFFVVVVCFLFLFFHLHRFAIGFTHTCPICYFPKVNSVSFMCGICKTTKSIDQSNYSAQRKPVSIMESVNFQSGRTVFLWLLSLSVRGGGEGGTRDRSTGMGRGTSTL